MRLSGHKYTAIGCALGALVCLSTPSHANDEMAVVEAIRAATERFQDVNVALAEGYIRDPADHCVKAEDVGEPAELGVMGIHFFRPDLLGITSTDPRVDGTGLHTNFENPSVLIYEPQADGSLVLVAVENLVFVKAWKQAGNTEPPTLAGRSWDYMADNPDTEIDEAHGFEPHYDQHVWAFRDNPAGALMPFSTAASCEHHSGHGH